MDPSQGTDMFPGSRIDNIRDDFFFVSLQEYINPNQSSPTSTRAHIFSTWSREILYRYLSLSMSIYLSTYVLRMHFNLLGITQICPFGKSKFNLYEA